jgi:hypothetical protein
MAVLEVSEWVHGKTRCEVLLYSSIPGGFRAIVLRNTHIAQFSSDSENQLVKKRQRTARMGQRNLCPQH